MEVIGVVFTLVVTDQKKTLFFVIASNRETPKMSVGTRSK